VVPVAFGEAEVGALLLVEAAFNTDAPNAARPEAGMEVRLSVAAVVPVAVLGWVVDGAAVGDVAATVDGAVREADAGRFVSFRDNELPDDCPPAGGAVAAEGVSPGAMSRA
jgi:hypothetical protein